MKTMKQLLESTGEAIEEVTEHNFYDLERNAQYKCFHGSQSSLSLFQGWVDADDDFTTEEGPEGVYLLFRDVKDGDEWTAYYHKGYYRVGSSADVLSVLEI